LKKKFLQIVQFFSVSRYKKVFQRKVILRKMQVILFILMFQSIFVVNECRLITNKIESDVERPRIFWNALGSMIESVDWLPLEINVPDSISSVAGGIGNVWNGVTSFFSGGGSSSPPSPSTQTDYDSVEQENQISTIGATEIGVTSMEYEIIDPEYNPDSKKTLKKKHKLKKIKNKRKIVDEDDISWFDLLEIF
jgi:hypothetical protein